MTNENDEQASISVKVIPDLSVLRMFLKDMLSVIDKYDDGEHVD